NIRLMDDTWPCDQSVINGYDDWHLVLLIILSFKESFSASITDWSGHTVV
ncbi:hypothetical protein A2U01_0020663, partial [Trifolium medium]|nr:hypothetical protein [Trifolium medium]